MQRSINYKILVSPKIGFLSTKFIMSASRSKSFTNNYLNTLYRPCSSQTPVPRSRFPLPAFQNLFIYSFTGEPTECRKYKILSGADRATSFNNASRYTCDDLLSNGWYRMAGEAGDHIPEKCVPKRHCGTHAPGWLDGKHPTVQEGLVTRRVCYHWRSSCCQWENNVTIRNCGNYCVYKLRRPPVCHLRYCGESDGEYIFQALTLAYKY